VAEGDGSTRDYSGGGQKWISRRVLINKILRRTGGRERTQYVLYTPGPQDNDRDVFIEKGVPRKNLLGVDRERVNVERIRNRRNFAVSDRLDRVLWNWPDSRPVCAAYLDLCCGLELSLLRMTLALGSPAFAKSIIAINLLRGRDGSSEKVRSLLRASAESTGGDLSKHRGEQLIMFLLAAEAERRLECGEPEDEMRAHLRESEKLMAPEYFAYRSGKALHFDSVVFRNLDFAARFRAPGGPQGWRSIREECYCEKTRRRLAAQFALRTMAARGTFPTPLIR
jgi:hypothetical protein